MSYSPKTHIGAQKKSQVVLIIGIVIVFNVLISSVSIRADLTEEKLFTLSDATKTVLQNAPNTVTIKAFISKKIPDALLATRQDFKDLLNEYENAGGENVIIEYLDPDENERNKTQADKYGIQQIRFNTFGAEKFEITSGYFGMAILYEDKSENFPVLQQTENLEYDITSTIQKMSRKKTPVIGLISGHGEKIDPAERAEIEKQYIVQEILAQELENSSDGIDLALIVGPTQAIPPEDLYSVDQFAMSGKPVIILANGTTVDLQFFTATALNTGLNTLLEEYGIKINSDVAIDTLSNEALQFSSGIFSFALPYSAWPVITENGVNPDSPITSALRKLTFPWPSTLSIREDTGAATITPLFVTSPQSYSAQGQPIQLNPEALEARLPPEKSAKILGAHITGPLTSAFSGKEIPSRASEGETNSIINTGFIPSTESSNIIVVGSNNFLDPSVVQRSFDNFILLGNALDVMTTGQSLADIRSRGSQIRPIKILSKEQERTIKYGNIFSGVVIAVLVGFISTFRRRKKDRYAQNIYSDI